MAMRLDVAGEMVREVWLIDGTPSRIAVGLGLWERGLQIVAALGQESWAMIGRGI